MLIYPRSRRPISQMEPLIPPRKFIRFLLIIFAGIMTLFLAGDLMLVLKTPAFSTGTIIGMQSCRRFHSIFDSYCPMVVFEAINSTSSQRYQIEFVAKGYRFPKDEISIGDQVPIRYDPINFSKAEINTFKSIWWIDVRDFMFVVGIFLFAYLLV